VVIKNPGETRAGDEKFVRGWQATRKALGANNRGMSCGRGVFFLIGGNKKLSKNPSHRSEKVKAWLLFERLNLKIYSLQKGS